MSTSGQPSARVSSTVTLDRRPGPDPVRCDEFGFDLGTRDGVLVLRYESGGRLEIGASREDFLHQIHWSPDGPLAAEFDSQHVWLAPGQGLWARRAVSHYVRASTRQTVYRLCLRQAGPQLEGVSAAVVELSEAAQDAVLRLCEPTCSATEAASLRSTLLTGTVPRHEASAPVTGGRGYAATVVRAVAADPTDTAGLAAWARRLHVSSKTLQRDFQRTYGTTFSAWRAEERLTVARLLLARHPVSEVAELVGYASASAFVAAFGREFGQSPGAFVRDQNLAGSR